MDFLAEVTMSIMQKQRRKNPELGYAKDLLTIVEQILPQCIEKNIRVITNGGGANPKGCRDAIFRWCEKKGLRGIRIGTVLGDDILGQISEFEKRGIKLDNMETGEAVEKIRGRILSANVYFGAWPIVQALQQGAHVVITGRTADASLTLAPMAYEFGWSESDWDQLAAGIVAGHVLECGGQASGGNFSAGWRDVPDLAHIGFPIAEAYPDGDVVITKHEGTGGLVNVATVTEQLVYEIGDPRSYITPDCIADFTTIKLIEEGANRVRITGVRGRPAPESYKVSASYSDGFMAVGTLTYSWPDPLEKAKKADEILRTRLQDLGLLFDEIRTEFLGFDSTHGELVQRENSPEEVMLRVAVRSNSHKAVEVFGKEIVALILNGPPDVTGYARGRPKPSEVFAFWPALIPKSLVCTEVVVEEI